MNCQKCDTPMVIDTWNGWRWICSHCGYVDRPATNDEVAEQENEVSAYLKIQDEGFKK